MDEACARQGMASLSQPFVFSPAPLSAQDTCGGEKGRPRNHPFMRLHFSHGPQASLKLIKPDSAADAHHETRLTTLFKFRNS